MKERRRYPRYLAVENTAIMTEPTLFLSDTLIDVSEGGLDPREGVSLYFPLYNLLASPDAFKIKNSFVETTCGTICTGTSKALRELVRFVKEERGGRTAS